MLRFIRRSRLNIAVSVTTQARLRQHGIKSTVLYNWFDMDSAAASAAAAQKLYDGLFIGNQLPHKNLKLFLRLVQRFPTFAFAAIVPDMARPFISASGSFPNLTLFSSLSQQDYLRVIAESKTLVSPSLDEGFGRPPMEAGLAGVNILLSDIPIYRELYSDAAFFFDADDEEDLFRNFHSICSGTASRLENVRGASAFPLKHLGDRRAYVHTILAQLGSADLRHRFGRAHYNAE